MGLRTPSTSWGSRTGTALKVEHSKTLPPGPPASARGLRKPLYQSGIDRRHAACAPGVPPTTSDRCPHRRKHLKPRPRARSASSLPPAPARSVRRAGRDHRQESNKEKGKRGEGSEAEREDPEGAATAPSLPGETETEEGGPRAGTGVRGPLRPGARGGPALPEGSPRGRAQVWGWRSAGPHSSLSRPCESTIRHGRGRKPPAHMPPARAERPAGLLQSVSDTVWSAPATTAPSIAGATDLLSALSTEG